MATWTFSLKCLEVISTLRQTLPSVQTPILLPCLGQRLLTCFASLSFIPFHQRPPVLSLLPSALLLEPVLWPNQGGHTVPKHWSLLCYACNIWEGTLSQLYFFSDSLNVSQLHIFSESEDGSKYPLSPVSQQPVLPKPSHRQCATLLLCRGSVPEGQVGGFFSASASLEMCVKGEGVL